MDDPRARCAAGAQLEGGGLRMRAQPARRLPAGVRPHLGPLRIALRGFACCCPGSIPGSVSHHVLQRVVVRLLFDPEFVERVYADPDRALQGLDLSADERRLVVAPDRRAYGTDATRRNRALTELVREFPAASAV